MTGVDHTDKLDLLWTLGADHIIDYTKEDFTTQDERYDLIFDIPGNHSLAACRRALTPDGTYVLIGHDQYGATGHRWLGSLPRFLKLTILSLFGNQLPTPGSSLLPKHEAMAVLADRLEAGALTPVIDSTYSLSDVPSAIRHLETGRALGRIVISV